jgi:hypothetical protein
MPLDPRRVEAIFLVAAEYQDPEERAAMLEREGAADPELRERVQALLRTHDRFNRFINDLVVGSDGRARPSLASPGGPVSAVMSRYVKSDSRGYVMSISRVRLVPAVGPNSAGFIR